MLRDYHNKASGMDPLDVPTDSWVWVKPAKGGTKTHARRLRAGTVYKGEIQDEDVIAVMESDGVRFVGFSTFGKLYRKL